MNEIERLKRAWSYLMKRWTWLDDDYVYNWKTQQSWTTKHLTAICKRCDVLGIYPW